MGKLILLSMAILSMVHISTGCKLFKEFSDAVFYFGLDLLYANKVSWMAKAGDISEYMKLIGYLIVDFL